MYTIETLTITGQWVLVHPLTGRYETYQTFTEARHAATDAEYVTGQPTRAREL